MGYFYRFFRTIQLKVVIGAMVSLVSADSTATSGKVDIIISITVLIFYLSLAIVVYYLIRNKIKRLSRPSKQHQDRAYETLITESKLFKELNPVDKTNLCVLYTLIVDLAHDLLLPVILIIFVKSPYIQLVLVILATIAAGWFYIRNLPYKSKFDRILKIGNKCIYLTILLAFLFGNALQGKLTKSQSFVFFGFGVIGLLTFLLIFNALIMILGAFASLSNHLGSTNKVHKEVVASGVTKEVDLSIAGNRALQDEGNNSSNQSSLNLLDDDAQRQHPANKNPFEPERAKYSKQPKKEPKGRNRAPIKTIRKQQLSNDDSEEEEEKRGIGMKNIKPSRKRSKRNRPRFHNKIEKSFGHQKKKNRKGNSRKRKELNNLERPKKSRRKSKKGSTKDLKKQVVIASGERDTPQNWNVDKQPSEFDKIDEFWI